MSLSVIILTHNEAGMLGECLSALKGWAHQIFVVDSGSSDDTVTIAKREGATVLKNPFESFGKQRNWALEHCEGLDAWVLFLDADEIATPAFKHAVDQAIEQASDSLAGFYLCNQLMLDGQWLKRTGNFPTWQFRLLRLGRARFVDFGHGQKEGAIQGELGYVHEPYEHYAFYKGWSVWFAKHVRYAEQEARARAEHTVSMGQIFSKHSSRRNPALKTLLSHVPGWPIMRFFVQYVIKLGFLDGRGGLTYCLNIAWYEYLIRLNMREKR